MDPGPPPGADPGALLGADPGPPPGADPIALLGADPGTLETGPGSVSEREGTSLMCEKEARVRVRDRETFDTNDDDFSRLAYSWRRMRLCCDRFVCVTRRSTADVSA